MKFTNAKRKICVAMHNMRSTTRLAVGVLIVILLMVYKMIQLTNKALLSGTTDEKHKDGLILTAHVDTVAKACREEVDKLNAFSNFSVSQWGEDKTLYDEFFHGLCGGTYLEMGALDGVRYSNSHLFHRAFGWNGVLIELGPRNFELLKKNRPDEIATVHAAVCGERQMIHYYEKRAMGSIWEFSSKSFKKQWWKGVTLEDTTKIECTPLADILFKYAVSTSHYDFFSLDIEGGELQALLSLDYLRVSFGVILVEADSHNRRKNIAVRSFLQSKRYTFLWNRQGSDWFVNNDFHQIYKSTLVN